MEKSTKKIIPFEENPDTTRARLACEELRYNEILQDPKKTGWMKSNAP